MFSLFLPYYNHGGQMNKAPVFYVSIGKYTQFLFKQEKRRHFHLPPIFNQNDSCRSHQFDSKKWVCDSYLRMASLSILSCTAILRLNFQFW